jgi:hypothetical protein
MSGNLTVFPGGHLALQNHFRKEGTQAIHNEGCAITTTIAPPSSTRGCLLTLCAPRPILPLYAGTRASRETVSLSRLRTRSGVRPATSCSPTTACRTPYV